jgi:hypothetical protein
MLLADDPSLYLADFGVSVVAGDVTGLGILDMPSEIILDNQVITTDYTLTCEAAKFGALLYGSQLTVNGVAYTVRTANLLTDGIFVQLSLQRSTEVPYTTATTSLDANGPDASIDDLGIAQLDPDVDGGSPSSTYIDGNDLDGGAP